MTGLDDAIMKQIATQQKQHAVHSFAPYHPEPTKCEKCRRPRDNYHKSLCPICLYEMRQPDAQVIDLPERSASEAQRPTPA